MAFMNEGCFYRYLERLDGKFYARISINVGDELVMPTCLLWRVCWPKQRGFGDDIHGVLKPGMSCCSATLDAGS